VNTVFIIVDLCHGYDIKVPDHRMFGVYDVSGT
jgi:hypothetical protein